MSLKTSNVVHPPGALSGARQTRGNPKVCYDATETQLDSTRVLSSLAPALKKENVMDLNLALTPIVSLLAGILVFVFPRLLSKIVAIYLIAVGLIGIFGADSFNF